MCEIVQDSVHILVFFCSCASNLCTELRYYFLGQFMCEFCELTSVHAKSFAKIYAQICAQIHSQIGEQIHTGIHTRICTQNVHTDWNAIWPTCSCTNANAKSVHKFQHQLAFLLIQKGELEHKAAQICAPNAVDIWTASCEIWHSSSRKDWRTKSHKNSHAQLQTQPANWHKIYDLFCV